MMDTTDGHGLFHNVTDSGGHYDNVTHDGGHGDRVHVISWNFDYVAEPLIVVVFILVAMFLKLGFHYVSFLSSIIPESCLLIIAGTIFGAILKAAGLADSFQLIPRTFLLFLLPPIVLDSAYSLNDRVFFQNIGTILIYAVIGTVLNFVMLGPTLYGLNAGGAMGHLDITLVECLLFSSFIVAVDPVAVLAIFQEIGVNNVLYFLVFGESLLNDAVTVVLSNMMKAFEVMEERQTIPANQIAVGITSFFTVSLGGLAIGLLFGVLTAMTTKATAHVRVVEPLAVIILAYGSYLFAELVHWSGIIAMIGCGLVQAQYAFHNVSRKSLTTVKYFIKMLSACNDTIIFLFLGIELVSIEHYWHPGFILWTLFYILVFRLIVTFALSFLINQASPVHRIDFEEQFIMWYGGLRGAVCFALCDTIRQDFSHRRMFLTTTLVVILFTVFIQGITIKPLVNLCRIKRKDDDTSKLLFEEFHCRVTDHLMTGMEVVIQHKGSNTIRSWLVYLDDKYFRRWFTKNQLTTDEQIIEEYANILLKDYEDDVKRACMKPPVPDDDDSTAKSTFYHKVTPSPLSSPRMKRQSTLHDPSGSTYDEELAGTILRRRAMRNQSSDQRKSLSDIISGKRLMNLEDPTVGDMKQLLQESSMSEATRHQKYDRNLMNDDKRDLEFFLHEKRLRKDRLRRMGLMSQAGSQMGSPGPSPEISRARFFSQGEDNTRGSPKSMPTASKLYRKRDDNQQKLERHHLLKRQDAETVTPESSEMEMKTVNNNKR